MKESGYIRKIAVFDCDGVLLCSKHRYRTIETKKGTRIDLEHWRENEQFCDKDTPLPTAKVYKSLLAKRSNFVIIATSRILSTKDYAHIENTIGLPDAIVSRLHNKQKGHILKIEGIKRIVQDCNLNHINLSESMVLYEDNHIYLKNICDYFRCHGVYVPSEQGH